MFSSSRFERSSRLLYRFLRVSLPVDHPACFPLSDTVAAVSFLFRRGPSFTGRIQLIRRWSDRSRNPVQSSRAGQEPPPLRQQCRMARLASGLRFAGGPTILTLDEPGRIEVYDGPLLSRGTTFSGSKSGQSQPGQGSMMIQREDFGLTPLSDPDCCASG